MLKHLLSSYDSSIAIDLLAISFWQVNRYTLPSSIKTIVGKSSELESVLDGLTDLNPWESCRFTYIRGFSVGITVPNLYIQINIYTQMYKIPTLWRIFQIFFFYNTGFSLEKYAVNQLTMLSTIMVQWNIPNTSVNLNSHI